MGWHLFPAQDIDIKWSLFVRQQSRSNRFCYLINITIASCICPSTTSCHGVQSLSERSKELFLVKSSLCTGKTERRHPDRRDLKNSLRRFVQMGNIKEMKNIPNQLEIDWFEI